MTDEVKPANEQPAGTPGTNPGQSSPGPANKDQTAEANEKRRQEELAKHNEQMRLDEERRAADANEQQRQFHSDQLGRQRNPSEQRRDTSKPDPGQPNPGLTVEELAEQRKQVPAPHIAGGAPPVDREGKPLPSRYLDDQGRVQTREEDDLHDASRNRQHAYAGPHKRPGDQVRDLRTRLRHGDYVMTVIGGVVAEAKVVGVLPEARLTVELENGKVLPNLIHTGPGHGDGWYLYDFHETAQAINDDASTIEVDTPRVVKPGPGVPYMSRDR